MFMTYEREGKGREGIENLCERVCWWECHHIWAGWMKVNDVTGSERNARRLFAGSKILHNYSLER